MTVILTPISIDRSPVLFSLIKEESTVISKRVWKFNSSLTKDQKLYN